MSLHISNELKQAIKDLFFRNEASDMWFMKGESQIMISYPDTYQGEEKQDQAVLRSRQKRF